MRKTTAYIFTIVFSMILISCLEEFNAATTEFEDAIVIEATITDQLKRQQVTLSRTFKFEDNGPTAETGAIVRVQSGNTIYTFTETSPGTYLSDAEFKAETNTNYQLSITTSNGREYSSVQEQVKDNIPIERVYAEREINEDGVIGVAVYVDAYDPTGNAKFYGYEFEETYQIIAPYWVPDEFVILNLNPFEFTVRPRTREERVCYNDSNSKGRLITDTSLLGEDRVSKFLITFIPEDDIRLNSRYSILLR